MRWHRVRGPFTVGLALLCMAADCRGEPSPPAREAVCVNLDPEHIGLTCADLCGPELVCAEYHCEGFADYTAALHSTVDCADAYPELVGGECSDVMISPEHQDQVAPDLASIECCCRAPDG